MDWQILGAFLVATTVFLATPGPVMAVVIGNTLKGGHTVGLRTVLGIGLGEVMVLGLLAVSLLLSSRFFGHVFPWFSLASAAYLIWLAANTVLCGEGPARTDARTLSSRPFLDGFAVTVSNPAALLFYSAFFMPFVARSDSPAAQFGILAALYVPLSIVSDLMCVMLIARLVHRRFRGSAYVRVARLLSAAVYLGTSTLAVASFLQMIASQN
jgi:threonine/homoserine/homoserine lactone efflux protein